MTSGTTSVTIPENLKGKAFWKRKEVLNFLNIGETKLHALMKDGTLEYVKDGKSTKMIPDSVIAHANRLIETARKELV